MRTAEIISSKKRGTKVTTKRTRASSNGTVAALNDTPNPDSPYLTTQEAAAYIKMSRQFLEAARYKGDGSGPAYIKLGRAVRYRRCVLDAWMSAHDHAADKPIISMA